MYYRKKATYRFMMFIALVLIILAIFYVTSDARAGQCNLKSPMLVSHFPKITKARALYFHENPVKMRDITNRYRFSPRSGNE